MLSLRYRTPACSDGVIYWKALTEGLRGGYTNKRKLDGITRVQALF